MTGTADRIHVVGAGRMGQGIAQAFAYGGIAVTLIDVKDRTADQLDAYFAAVRGNLERELAGKVDLGRLTQEQAREVLGRVQLLGRTESEAQLAEAGFVFEAVPEVLTVKQDTFSWLSALVPAQCIIASTTSTFLVTELAALVSGPERFINAHWLNPADVVPLVEISRSGDTDQDTIDRSLALLKSIGKVPVICAASAGYIVPRLQALAMNEAARMVEEGVASAEDIDTAVRVGFGFRFSVLGMLEFIDWGGGDILHYASQYLSEQLGERFEAPDVIKANVGAGRNGLRDGEGFYQYDVATVDEYKVRRMREFWRQLDSSGLTPRFNAAVAPLSGQTRTD